MTELVCPIALCHSRDIEIELNHSYGEKKPAKTITVRCKKCGKQIIYDLVLVQDAILDRIDEI